MNGVHDMGGMHGFGPVTREKNEPVFHAEWEGRVFALSRFVMARRMFNLDEFRRAIERIPPARYLDETYYERWLEAMVALLVEKGIITPEQLDAVANRPGASDGNDAPAVSNPDAAVNLSEITATQGRAQALRYDRSFKPKFKVGDRIVARNINPEGHTRLPRYARGRHGVIRHDWGVFVFPDTHAHGLGANPQHCYSVEFDSHELWGGEHSSREPVFLDMWEDYMDADKAVSPSRVRARKPAAEKASAKVARKKPSRISKPSAKLASPHKKNSVRASNSRKGRR